MTENTNNTYDKNPLREIMKRVRAGEPAGIPSYCTANEFVIKTILRRASETGRPVLIEATANQVNQFGGYTGMKPAEYYDRVLTMADEAGVHRYNLILAGDHLGPLTWQHLPEAEAMTLASELVYEYARAGFTKIHLDTSMKLADDPDGPLSPMTVAGRGAVLYKSAMRGYNELLTNRPDAARPVFIIGSEVPIPGGAREALSVEVTHREDLCDTIEAYRTTFTEAGVADGLNDVIAVVVQPGVEFGDCEVSLYDRAEAADLMDYRRNELPEFAFEGHSTDYQSRRALREMAEDGVAILKVGPALTYAYREALFALSMIEREILHTDVECADFIGILDKVMTENPANWQKHYHGDGRELALARKYSFSDRARYYIGEPEVEHAICGLFNNLRLSPIPLNILHQYMPVQAALVISGDLDPDPEALVQNAILQVLYDYEYACGHH